MDEAKRMEEGFSTPHNGDGDSIEQIVEQEQPSVKQKTKRVATLDAFRGLTIVVSVT